MSDAWRGWKEALLAPATRVERPLQSTAQERFVGACLALKDIAEDNIARYAWINFQMQRRICEVLY